MKKVYIIKCTRYFLMNLSGVDTNFKFIKKLILFVYNKFYTTSLKYKLLYTFIFLL